MISALLFDFGGTLDADGQHWLDRFYAIYESIVLPEVPKDRIKEAFYWADEQAEIEPKMRQAGLREMIERHVAWQFQKLGLADAAQMSEMATAFCKPADRILRRNRHVLEKLAQSGLKLGIISNFYGNVEALCREFAYTPHLEIIFDSAVMGLKKPDHKLFALAIDKLKVPADQIGFIGDSFERDILPAKALGMKTFWLLGDRKLTAPDPTKVDYVLRSLEDLPHELAKHPQGKV